MSIVLIGDVHGDTHIYQKMLRRRLAGRRTIQIGDMGIGFKGVGLHKMPLNHRWIRGNHDNPQKCRDNYNYLGDWGILNDDSLFYLAGAFSIDRDSRIMGINWWQDEELSWIELQQAIDLYKEFKPRFVVSHEAPSEAAKRMLHEILAKTQGSTDAAYFAEKMACTMSRTSEALQVMFDAHQPKEWVFGHYHLDNTFDWKGTKFTCVGILKTYELETGNLSEIGMMDGLKREK